MTDPIAELKNYARHKPECHKWGGGGYIVGARLYNGHDCDCGLEAVLAALVPSSPPEQAQNPPRRQGHDSPDWIARVAADIRDINPDYHDFECEVERLIRSASSPPQPEEPCTTGVGNTFQSPGGKPWPLDATAYGQERHTRRTNGGD